MHVIIGRLFIVLAAFLLLTACTRERPLPDPTATSAMPGVVRASATTPPVEPQVTAVPVEPTPTQEEAQPTPAPAVETVPYVVQPGDTLASIAAEYGTDVETLKEINNLTSDAILVGQPLYVPVVEGVSAPGLPSPTPGPVVYVVQPGDTLTGIALQFNVDPIAIQERNNLLDADNLTVGATIIIPGAQPQTASSGGETGETASGTTPVATPSAEGVVHVVQSGESLTSIAVTYDVSVEEIAAANGISTGDVLRIGQELIIPGVTPREAAEAQGNIHVVQPGESLFGIAVLYNVTVEEIIAANDLTNPDALVVGQELIIPRR